MHSFRVTVKIFSFIGILILLVGLCNAIVEEPTYTRLMIYDMYHNDENYSMAFLGASHVYQSFNPVIFDRKLEGCNSINLGSSGQSLTGSYILLKELLKTNIPDTVIMEVTYASYEDVYERSSLPEYSLFDYLKPSLNKLCYFFSAFPKEDYANALFPVYRNRSNIEILEIGRHLQQKRKDGYYQYRGFSHMEGWEYQCKGFVAIDWSYQNKDFEVDNPYKWSEDLVIDKEINYLKKITDLCKKKNIDIIWITAPVPVYSMIAMENYNEVHDYFDALAQKWEVEYYDFNYCRKDILERNDYLYFYDSGHMNKIYAEQFSNAVCQMLKRRNGGGYKV